MPIHLLSWLAPGSGFRPSCFCGAVFAVRRPAAGLPRRSSCAAAGTVSRERRACAPFWVASLRPARCGSRRALPALH